MRRNEKMAAIGQLAAGIAHEIRNPLASISGSIQLLKADNSTPENEKLFSIVLKEIDRLNLLITEFLDFARPEGMPSDPINPNTVLSEVMDMVAVNKQLPEGIRQERQLQSKSYILGQADKLKQVFLNLAINAYQAMEGRESSQLTVRSYEKDGHLLIEFEDNGAGMKPEIANRIFEPFLTTKAKGTGLGLATVHKILENHGAKIHLQTAPNEGTKFTLEFVLLNKDEMEDLKNNVIDMQRRRSQG
ncbi:MAG: GHKL domain-containing protein [Bdellovibrionales bacterium]|nr:GHKL domain-containing protein [Bdellovibrionales bacterium]